MNMFKIYLDSLSLCLSLFLSATQFCSVECETVAVQGSNTTGSFICNFHSKLCQGRTQHCHIKYPLSNLYFGNMQYCNWLQQVCAVFEKCVKNTAQAGVCYICPLISNDHVGLYLPCPIIPALSVLSSLMTMLNFREIFPAP